MYENQKCDRCHEKTISLMMSMFNTEMCCRECIKKERQHPMYEEAKRVEREHVLRKDYNFGGIGKPNDL